MLKLPCDLPSSFPFLSGARAAPTRYLLWNAWWLAALIACGGSEAGDGTPKGPGEAGGENAEQMVGLGGATLSVDGADVEIPEGAVDAQVAVRVRRLSDGQAAALPAPDVGGELEAVSPVMELTPHGTTFVEAVRVVLQTEGTADVVLRLADADATIWEPVYEAELSDGTASFYTDRFSFYAAYRLSDDGSLVEPDELDSCEDAVCDSTQTKVCSDTAATCSRELPGVVLASSLGRRPQSFVTSGYATDLADPSAPGYLGFLSAGVGSPLSLGSQVSEIVLSFLPMDEAPTVDDLVTTEPFSLTVEPGGAALLIVRGIFALDQGARYVVVGEATPVAYAGRPVILLLTPGTAGVWSVAEVVPELGAGAPYAWTSWQELRLGSAPVVTAREAGQVHVIVGLSAPGSQRADTIHRFGIPTDGLSEAGGSTLTPTTTETSHAFPLSDNEDLDLVPVAVGPGPDGQLAVFAHGQRLHHDEATDTYSTHYDVQVQLWDAAAGTRLAQRSFENTENPATGRTVGGMDCGSLTVSSTGGALGHMDASGARIGDGGSLEDVAAMAGYGSLLAYVQADASGDLSMTRSQCTTPLELGSHPSLMAARFERAGDPSTFSSVWNVASPTGEGDAVAVVSAPDPASDELEVQTLIGYGGSLLSAVPTLAGYRVYTMKDDSAGWSLSTFNMRADGSLVDLAETL